MEPRFQTGQEVTWCDAVPATWKYVYTPGPMIIKSVDYHGGKPSAYALKFHPGGMGIEPGYLYEVEFAPTSNFHLLKRLILVVHEKWLRIL